MDERVRLVEIRSEDRPFLLGVYGSTRADELALVNWTEEQKRQFVAMQFEAQDRYYRANWPDAEYDVVYWDEQPAGRLIVDRRENEIRVMDLALLPEFRSKGIGTFLLRRAMQEARATNKPVTIHVERHNRALSLYGRLGFVPIQEEGIYILMRWLPAGT